MSLLRSKLFDLEQEKQRSEIAAQRKSQVSATQTCRLSLLQPWMSVCWHALLWCMSSKQPAETADDVVSCFMHYFTHVCSMHKWLLISCARNLVSPGSSICLFFCVEMQVGTGGRSEKIKTYNFKDSRMSDHRTKNNYDLNKMLSGAIEEPIQAMIALEQRERLAELSSNWWPFGCTTTLKTMNESVPLALVFANTSQHCTWPA